MLIPSICAKVFIYEHFGTDTGDNANTAGCQIILLQICSNLDNSDDDNVVDDDDDAAKKDERNDDAMPCFAFPE